LAAYIIIIITNEKIKVTLSRKRCRDTLQDYKKGEISKCQSKLWTNRNVAKKVICGTRKGTSHNCPNAQEKPTIWHVFESFNKALEGLIFKKLKLNT